MKRRVEATAMAAMLLLLASAATAATIDSAGNSSNITYYGDDVELLMEWNAAGRMLFSGGPYSDITLSRGRAANRNCGRNRRYTPCVPEINIKRKNIQSCRSGAYNRDCLSWISFDQFYSSFYVVNSWVFFDFSLLCLKIYVCANIIFEKIKNFQKFEWILALLIKLKCKRSNIFYQGCFLSAPNMHLENVNSGCLVCLWLENKFFHFKRKHPDV